MPNITRTSDAPATIEAATVPSDVEQIADLARRDAERTPEPYWLDDDDDRSLVLAKLRGDERIEKLNLEEYLDQPNRARGGVAVHDPSDFVDVVNRLANAEHTTVWANVEHGAITAVVNDHARWDAPGWRDHTATLRLQEDEDWRRWIARDGKLLAQEDFAQFLEDVAHTVIEPDNATMIEVATSMIAKREVEFSQATRLQTGDVQLRYEETTKANAGAKGDMEVPEKIVVRVSPWRGVLPADLDARLRWRIVGGQLAIGYRLLRPDAFRDEVFAGLVAKVRDGLANDVPLYLGATPNPLHH